MATSNNGGYPLSIFISKINEADTCDACYNVLKEPLQTSCGHRICKECYESRSGRCDFDLVAGPKCPTCDEFLLEDEVFHDRFAERNILDLQTRCPNEILGCNWTGVLKHHVDHVLHCPFGEGGMQTHTEEDLIMMSLSDEQKHIFPVKLLLSKFESSTCPFSFVGCRFELEDLKRTDMGDHLEQNLMEHLCDARKCVEDLRTKQNDLTKELSNRVVEMTKIVQKNRTLQDKLEMQERHIESLKLKVDTWKGNGEKIGIDIDKLEKQIMPEHEVRRLEMMLTSGKRYPVMSDQMQRHDASGPSKRSTAYDKMLDNKLTALEDESVRQNVTLANLNLRLCLLNSTTYDGTLLWRIDNLESRMKEAVKGSVPSLFSPPFYTNRFGVRLCCRLYLNGDGKCKTKYVSLFIVIMKGEFDDILQWPFKKKITFSLIDQSGEGNNVVKTFHADPNSSSFRKPEKEMNIASGCPYFLDQNVLFTTRKSDKSEAILRTESPYISRKSIMIKAAVSDP